MADTKVRVLRGLRGKVMPVVRVMVMLRGKVKLLAVVEAVEQTLMGWMLREILLVLVVRVLLVQFQVLR